jgi:DNA (cytosine-5)-methyltransferase 1
MFKFIDLFAGVGGIRTAFERAGGKCVFSSEWNKFAQKTYQANFGEIPFGDITKIPATDIPDHDILVGGFPCQPFSIAGVSIRNSLGREHGFKDKTQGTLFFEVVRILDEKRPKALMLENVKNLVSHDKGNTIKTIIGALQELGYTVTYKVIDAKGMVPQHRERIFIVGFLNDKTEFKFPEMTDNGKRLKDILEPNVPDKYTLTDGLMRCLENHKAKHKAKGNGFGFKIADLNGFSKTLSARYYKDGAEILIPQEGKNPRRLTPRECARLMGFDDDYKIICSDIQSYKQFGNCVAVPVVTEIAKKVAEHLKEVNSP